MNICMLGPSEVGKTAYLSALHQQMTMSEQLGWQLLPVGDSSSTARSFTIALG